MLLYISQKYSSLLFLGLPFCQYTYQIRQYSCLSKIFKNNNYIKHIILYPPFSSNKQNSMKTNIYSNIQSLLMHGARNGTRFCFLYLYIYIYYKLCLIVLTDELVVLINHIQTQHIYHLLVCVSIIYWNFESPKAINNHQSVIEIFCSTLDFFSLLWIEMVKKSMNSFFIMQLICGLLIFHTNSLSCCM